MPRRSGPSCIGKSVKKINSYLIGPGNDVLRQLSELRCHSGELDGDPARQMALRLRLARGWVRAVVGGYLYRLALEQMRETQ